MSKSEEKSAEVMEGGIVVEEDLYKSMAERMSSESKKKAGEACSTYQLTLHTIYKVPEWLRKVKPSAYIPRVVSIGPLHRNNPRFRGIEDHKFRYMHTLFDRTAKSEDDADRTLHECVDAIEKLTPDARTCYGESLKDGKYTDAQLAKTLLVDGCFILELLFLNNRLIEASMDPLFTNNMALGGIIRDLLLLENQIPFFVLQQLFQLTLQEIEDLTLTQYVVRFFGPTTIFGGEMTERDNGRSETDYDHILGFLHNYYQPASKPGDFPAAKYSATQLHRTGVKFKASERKDCLHVRFQTSGNTRRRESTSEEETRNHQVCAQTSSICKLFNGLLPSNCRLFRLCSSPCLELPPLCVYDETESFLRNLIAYEQCSLTVPYYITSYAFLMDTLINSKEDVELLEDEGVLQNGLGASEDASDLFNNLCKEICLSEFYFSDEWKQLDDYCKLCWPKHLSSLRSTYFSNPWAIISLGGALLLFGLTILQTVYSIK